jgi:hypothetical protein
MATTSLVTLYRISDASYRKVKLEHATKLHCLENHLSVFGREGLVLFADNCTPGTLAQLRALGLEPRESASPTPAKSWRMVAEYALERLPGAQAIYFVEDDYLHLPDARPILLEGLEIADYVTLFDHPDKYVNGRDGGNPEVKRGGELSRVLLTRSTHWKWTNSTTMTVATRVETLREDRAVWWWYTRGRHPKDYDAFYRLRRRILGRRRVLISPIPGRSTHVEMPWLGPLVDWSEV